MNRIARIPTVRILALAAAVALALLSFNACGNAEEEETAAQAERMSRLEELEQQQEELEQIREELADLRARRVAAESGDGEIEADGETEALDPTALRTEIDQKNAELTEKADAFNQAVTEFINADPPVPGEPTSEATVQAIALKVDEDIALAKEYITEGGDYARAISIYDNILTYSPDDPKVLAAKEEAERLRYMDEERFAQIEKGMTEGEIEQLLGPVNPRNRRVHEDVGRAAWYYPKSAEGDAAGVFFRERDGRMEVYETDWDAVPKRGEGDDEATA